MFEKIKNYIREFCQNKIVNAIIILLKVYVPMGEGVFCSIVANRIYNTQTKTWDFRSNLSLFIPCTIIALLLIILSVHDVKKSNLSLKERKDEKIFESKVKAGLFDSYAKQLTDAVKYGDTSKFKAWKEIEGQL